MPAQRLDLSDVTFDPLLTRLSVGWFQERKQNAITSVFPILEVGIQSGQYIEWNQEDLRRRAMQRRGVGQEAESVQFGKSDQSFSTEEFALKVPLDETVIASAASQMSGLTSLRQAAGRYLTQQALLHLDDAFVSNYFTTSAWTTTKDGSGTDFTQWENDNGTPFDILDEFFDDVEKTGIFRPNVGVLGKAVWRELKNHTETFNRISIGQTPDSPKRITPDLVAEAMGLDRLIVPSLTEETATTGAASSPSFVFPEKEALFVYAPDQPSLLTPSGGYIFAWVEAFDGQANEFGAVMDRIERGAKHSEEVEIRMHYDMKQVAADVGLYLQNAVA